MRVPGANLGIPDTVRSGGFEPEALVVAGAAEKETESAVAGHPVCLNISNLVPE